MNDLDNLGVRGQLLFAPSDKLAITATADYTRQRPEGYTQVVAGVAPTLRTANRQYPQIAADLGYTPPSFNAFDRLTDIDTPLRSYQDLGGASLTVDWKLGPGRLTSTTAWRYWDWKPSNDRDFIGLPITTISAAPSKQRQWTQEVRYAGDLAPTVNLVAGAFAFQPDARLEPVLQAGAGRGGRALPAGAERGRGDTGPSRRLRLQSVRRVRERQRGGVRPARVVGHRSPAPAARPSVQLRPEGRGLRPAGLWRSADDRSRAHRAAAFDLCAAGLHGGRGRHQPVGSDDRGVQDRNERQRLRDVRDRLQVGRSEPQRRAHRRVGPAGPLGRDRQARRRASHRGRRQDRTLSRCYRQRHGVRHRDRRTSRRRS